MTKDDYIEWSQTHFMCPVCKCPRSYDDAEPNYNICRFCAQQEREQQLIAAQDTSALTIPRYLQMLIGQEPTNKIRAGAIVQKLIEMAGGEAEIGNQIGKKLQKILNDPTLPLKEQRAWIKLVMGMVQHQEKMQTEHGKSPLADLTERELRELLKPMAIELLKSDPDFLAECLRATGVTIIDQDHVLESELVGAGSDL